jgi:hypothetical protein
MKVEFERSLAITSNKGSIAKTATAAAMNAIVPEDKSTGQMK